MFERADFARLADQLEAIEGRFILSINDTPGAREAFGRFAVETVAVTYTIATTSAGGGVRVGELIVSEPGLNDKSLRAACDGIGS